MRVLVIGSGGREHALAWAVSRSPQVDRVYVAPGNGGTDWPRGSGAGLQPLAPCTNLDIRIHDFAGCIERVRALGIGLTLVGPEVPLAEGIVDAFQAELLPIFGPSQAGARLEASKAFAKAFMQEQGIPTAAYGVFDSYAPALDFVHRFEGPVVVKASGLAAGKGVLVCDTVREAESALKAIMQQRQFGSAGDQVIVEERLNGSEVSLLAFCDGKTVLPMITARDYKRALEGDQGLNTGGMGAFAPASDVTPAQIDEIRQAVLQAVLDGMAARGTPYVGLLYAGLMLTDRGIKVLEFNCRFGDPETQVVLPLLDSDLIEIAQACIDGRLDEIDLCWKGESCATVALTSPGYPGDYPKGLPISGLDCVDDERVVVFHAGTTRKEDQLLTSGGRVLNVTAVGPDLDSALNRVYAAVDRITFEGMQYRRDIGGRS